MGKKEKKKKHREQILIRTNKQETKREADTDKKNETTKTHQEKK